MSRANVPPIPNPEIRMGETRHHGRHKHNPPGSKFFRRAYKNHHSVKTTYKNAIAWYASLENGK